MARPLALLAATGLFALPPPASAAPSVLLPEFARQCPAQHLENMTPGDLELLMEDFEARLTPTEKRLQQELVGKRCALIEAGLSCGNAATAEAYRRLRRLKAFVHEACASGWTCRGFADCNLVKP